MHPSCGTGGLCEHGSAGQTRDPYAQSVACYTGAAGRRRSRVCRQWYHWWRVLGLTNRLRAGRKRAMNKDEKKSEIMQVAEIEGVYALRIDYEEGDIASAIGHVFWS